MSTTAPPASPQVDKPTRPAQVSSASALLMLSGLLNLLSSFVIFGSSRGSLGTVVGGLAVVFGVAALYSGVQVRRLKESGRVTGLVVASVGALFNVYAITQGVMPQFLGLAANGYVIYALNTSKEAFSKD